MGYKYRQIKEWLLKQGNFYQRNSVNKINIGPSSIEITVYNKYVVYIAKKYSFDGNPADFEEFLKKISKVIALMAFDYPIIIDFDDYSVPKPNIIYIFNGQIISQEEVDRLYAEHENLRMKFDKNIKYQELRKIIGYSGETVIDPKYLLESSQETQDKYQQLALMAEQLPEEVKEALIIYKTSLFECINMLSSIPNYEDMDSAQLYNQLMSIERCKETIQIFGRSRQWKRLLEMVYSDERLLMEYSPTEQQTIKNLYAKIDLKLYAILEKIDLKTKAGFIESLKKVLKVLEQSKDLLILPFDMLVFRGIGTNEDDTNELARGNIISTTIEYFKTFSYTSGTHKKIYCLNLKKGVPFLIFPYTVVAAEIDYKYKRVIYQLQKESDFNTNEILLFGDTLDKKEIASLPVDRKGVVYDHSILVCSKFVPEIDESVLESSKKI
ncbi:MAG: hypothetical protein E7161_03755 [Firmicutes bacterium]|nr:hypothetical protein [Bacillota bacterium]